MTSRASVGKVNEVLLLDDLLPGAPPDDVLPLLEKEVLREGGPDSPSVAPVLLGVKARVWSVMAVEPSKSNDGISTSICDTSVRDYIRRTMCTYRPQ